MTVITQGILNGWPPVPDGNSLVTSSQVLNSASNKVAWVIQLPRAVNITEVFVSFISITAPPVYGVSVQGVDPATGFPDGVVKGGGSPVNATFTPVASALSGTWIPLANAYPGVRGEYISIVAEYASGTIGASNTATLRYACNLASNHGLCDVGLTNTGAGWVKNTVGGFHYGFRSLVAPATVPTVYGAPVGTATAKTLSATVEAGIKFRFDAGWGETFRVGGVKWKGALWPTGNMIWVTLYEGVNVLQQVNIPSDMAASLAVSPINQRVFFDEAILTPLKMGYFYYLGLCGTASRTSAMVTVDSPATNDQSAFTQGLDQFYASRTLGTPVTNLAGPASGDTAWIDADFSHTYMWPMLNDWTEHTSRRSGLVRRR